MRKNSTKQALALESTRECDRRISASRMPPGTATSIVSTVSSTVMPAPSARSARCCQTMFQLLLPAGRTDRSPFDFEIDGFVSTTPVGLKMLNGPGMPSVLTSRATMW